MPRCSVQTRGNVWFINRTRNLDGLLRAAHCVTPLYPRTLCAVERRSVHTAAHCALRATVCTCYRSVCIIVLW